MQIIESPLLANQVVAAFQHDWIYLFLGAAFITVGIVAATLSFIRRDVHSLMVWFGLFAGLVGARLWLQSELLAQCFPHAALREELSPIANYAVVLVAIVLFNKAKLLDSRLIAISHGVAVLVSGLVIATSLFGPLPLFRNTYCIVMCVAITIFVIDGLHKSTTDITSVVIRRGLLTYLLFSLCPYVLGCFGYRLRLEPYGFTILLAALGYVTAERTFRRDQQLRQIRQELEIAERIQRSTLPDTFPASKNFAVVARYLPLSSVAGDFYDFVVADDRQAGLFIADASGHGVPAALICSMIKLAVSLLRGEAGHPSKLISKMNSILFGNTQRQFVTAAYVHLDSDTRELQYSGAGHPPMLILRDGEVTALEENGLILGVLPHASYTTKSHPLKAGDRILLYTDGITEAFNLEDEEFGQERLGAVFKQSAHLSISETADQIVSSIRAWCPSQSDDLTLMICEYRRLGAAA